MLCDNRGDNRGKIQGRNKHSRCPDDSPKNFRSLANSFFYGTGEFPKIAPPFAETFPQLTASPVLTDWVASIIFLARRTLMVFPEIFPQLFPQ
jgi:hypothetical protein